MARQFVLVRITNMRGVDLTVFDFDFDLTWAALFMNADQKIYSRYGGRDEGHAEKALSLTGLKYAMKAALESYRRDPEGKGVPFEREFQQVEQYPSATRVKKDACIHCHQVYDFRRDFLYRKNKWSPDYIWVYPPPENIGITVDTNQGDRIVKVAADSAAESAGLQPGDVLESVNGYNVASYGDVQYALHKSPKQGNIAVAWNRQGQTMTAKLKLKKDWRKSDISWRGSMWGLEPRANVYGKDLTAEQKIKLGLSPKRLAFKQGNYVPPEARRAGVRGGDIIIGADGKKLEMSMLQFNVWVRLNYKLGDTINYNIIRRGKRMDIPLLLEARK